MKPYVSEILEKDGKTYMLPMPAKHRELFDCVNTLGLKTEADEDAIKRIGYKALYVPEPDLNVPNDKVKTFAAKISELTETQVMAIGALCSAFELPFDGVRCILTAIQIYMEVHNEN